MESNKISIIVPCYNIEQYIERAVYSICKQTYTNLEIILVDDGSKDHTPQIIDKLAEKDDRIKVIHKENKGVTSARLLGINKATGEWIGFVDGDDIIDSDMYERLIYNALHYRADISHCGYRMVFPNREDYYYNTGLIVEQNNKQGIIDLLEGKRIEPGLCNKLFRKFLIQGMIEKEKIDFSIKNLEDLLMNYYLFKESNKSIYEDFCPYNYMVRVGSAATSTWNRNKLEDPLKVFGIIKKDLEYDEFIQNIIDDRVSAILIKHATLPKGEQEYLIRNYRKNARRLLKKNLKIYIKRKHSIKQKIFYLWACILPDLYTWVHEVYMKISGLNKKYNVE